MSDALLTAADLHPPLSAHGMRIGLLGGSFNPPHEAHRLISLTALKRIGLAEVWWVVTPGNPIKEKSDLASLAKRVAWCRELAQDARIKVTAFETGLGTAYTALTLRYLRERFSEVHFVWLMGADNLATFHRWNEWQSIFDLMPIAVADRPQWRYRALASLAAQRFAAARIPEQFAPLLPELAPPAWCYLSGPLSDLSSTAIRQKSRRA